jgi:uncharacterized membrane protein
MNDQRLETIIGQLLRAGVVLAAAVVLAGAGLYLANHHSARVDFHTFRMERDDLRTMGGIARSAAHLDSEGIIQLGLLLLIATPVARVVFAAIGFHLEHDRMYTVVSLIVLAVLIFSLMHAS